MDLLVLLAQAGVLEKGSLTKLQKELATPGATEEGVVLRAGVPLQEILKAKGEYYGVPTRALGKILSRLIFCAMSRRKVQDTTVWPRWG